MLGIGTWLCPRRHVFPLKEGDRQAKDRVNSADVEFMSVSASGFHQTRRLSAGQWRYDGLAYAWENITKFAGMKPRWQIYNSISIIQGFPPHVDSIDPLLIASLSEQNKSSYAILQTTLSKMPGNGLRARLQQDTELHLSVRQILQEALRRQ